MKWILETCAAARAPWLRAWAGCAVCMSVAAAAPRSALAQSNVAPSSHWGASMLPVLEPRKTLGFELLGFTELGKDMKEDGTPVGREECEALRRGVRDFPCGTPDPYNQQGETIGFNLLTLSITHPLARYSLAGSNLLYTHTGTFGVLNDGLTEWYQNEIIHGAAGLQEIRREARACTPGWDRLSCYVVGYAGQLNYQFYSIDRKDSRLLFRQSPLFVGTGFQLSTIENELYVQAGLHRFDLTTYASPSLGRVVYLTLSGTVRAGTLFPSVTFSHLASQYLAAQGAIGVHFGRYVFPVSLEFGLTGTTGQFIERPRSSVDGVEVESEQSAPSLAEQFWLFRVDIGSFSFETFNDQLGGKDKGPSFGARVFYTFTPGRTLDDALAKL